MSLHVHSSGPRDPAAPGTVLFIHGFPFDGSMWRPQLDDLPHGWRGLAPDLRGFGQSPLSVEDGCVPTGKRLGNGIAHTGDPVLSMACLANDLARLIRAETGGDEAGGDGGPDAGERPDAVICGLSMGGYVALELVRRHPDLVRGLVLADTRAAADSDEARENRMTMAHSVRRAGTRPVASAMIPQLLAESTREDQPELVDRVQDMILDTAPETVIAALAGMATRHDSTGDLARIAAPTLVLVGEHDAITPPAEARAMADAIPDARLTIVPDAGHLAGLENPAAFNRALEGSLTGL